MKKIHVRAAMMAVAAVALAATAEAGQFKRLETTTLPIGGFVDGFSSAQNHNVAMQGDVFEFVTPAGGTFTCGIVANNTGRALTVRLISLTGSTLQTCTTPVNGGCTTPAQGLGGNFLFQCTVFGPGGGLPANANSIYILRVSRIAPFAEMEHGDTATPEETGLMGGLDKANDN
jgi:hypothetical protein